MKKLLLIMCCVMAFGSTAVAQNLKADRIKAIRTAYAQAKSKIERNGKNGQSPKDMRIILNQLDDEEYEVYDMETIDYYFDETIDNDVVTKHPYFIIEDWSCHGHIRYREVLVDPRSQQVMFCFMHGETDGGFVVESRYYYDTAGQCIEEKHNTQNTWTTHDSEKKNAEYYLKVFGLLQYNGYFTPLAADPPTKPTTPKAERMKHIRDTYAQAKANLEQNSKKDMPDELVVTTHDLGDNWPPRTTVTSFGFGKDGCYFVSQHTTSMAYDGYSEYLFEPKSQDLIFSYSRGREEGEVHEWRYYFDENGKCIETKSNSDETDDGFCDQRAAKDLQAIFQTLLSDGTE